MEAWRFRKSQGILKIIRNVREIGLASEQKMLVGCFNFSLSDTDLSSVHTSVRLVAYVNFFKSLHLLHFLLDSFETRYTYFLGQSPNFVLFRILKFGFSDFLWIFIEIHWNCYFSYIFQWIILKYMGMYQKFAISSGSEKGLESQGEWNAELRRNRVYVYSLTDWMRIREWVDALAEHGELYFLTDYDSPACLYD